MAHSAMCRNAGSAYDSFSNTWSGTVTSILRAMAATPDSRGTIGVTTKITFSGAVTVSVLRSA